MVNKTSFKDSFLGKYYIYININFLKGYIKFN